LLPVPTISPNIGIAPNKSNPKLIPRFPTSDHWNPSSAMSAPKLVKVDPSPIAVPVNGSKNKDVMSAPILTNRAISAPVNPAFSSLIEFYSLLKL
jgi:hypothetical protein